MFVYLYIFMGTRSREQMGCGSKPLSYLLAFRVLWWTFGRLLVDFESNCRRAFVKLSSNFCQTVVERSLNFRQACVELSSKCCRASVELTSVFRRCIVDLLSNFCGLVVEVPPKLHPKLPKPTKTTKTVRIKATSKAFMTRHLA